MEAKEMVKLLEQKRDELLIELKHLNNVIDMYEKDRAVIEEGKVIKTEPVKRKWLLF